MGLARDEVKRVSAVALRRFRDSAPELIQSIDAFSENVLWVPCSALGADPARVQPQWAEVPFLAALDSSVRASGRA